MDGTGVPELIVMLPVRAYDEAALLVRGDDLGASSPAWTVRLRWQRGTWSVPEDSD